MNEEYYVLEDGEKVGPFSFNQLINRGIDIDTPVSAPGDDNWHNASYLPEFIAYFETQGYNFPTEDNLAGFGWRTLAFIIDYMILSLVTGTICVKAGLLVFPASAKFDPAMFLNTLSQRSLLTIEACFVAVFLCYNVLFEASGIRGSIGKKVCGLKVVDADGRKLGIGMVFLRNLGAVTAYNLFGLIFLIINYFVAGHQQTWYERLGKTYMIKS